MNLPSLIVRFIFFFSGEVCMSVQTGGTGLSQDTIQTSVSLALDQSSQIHDAIMTLS